MKTKVINLLLVVIVFLLYSCGRKVDLKDEDSIKDWIHGKFIFIEGELVFNKNGTFKLIPQNQNDPTKLYTGTWSLGSFSTFSTGEVNTRDLTISFNNSGWITDGHNSNGISHTGFGKVIDGRISSGTDGYIFLADVSNPGMVWDGDNGGFTAGSKKWSRDFKEADEAPDESDFLFNPTVSKPPATETNDAQVSTSTQTVSSIGDEVNNQTQNKKEEFDFSGEWTGSMGGKDLALFIEKHDGNELSGYNQLGDNRRDLKGTYTADGGNISLELDEPGTDKWDGHFSIAINPATGTASGTWKSNNGRLKHSFELKRE